MALKTSLPDGCLAAARCVERQPIVQRAMTLTWAHLKIFRCIKQFLLKFWRCWKCVKDLTSAQPSWKVPVRRCSGTDYNTISKWQTMTTERCSKFALKSFDRLSHSMSGGRWAPSCSRRFFFSYAKSSDALACDQNQADGRQIGSRRGTLPGVGL